MLIDGRYAEELRMAVVDGETLLSYKVQMQEAGSLRGNIYRGVVTNVESSLDAAFVDYGAEKHGFLASHDVVEQAHHRKGGGARIEGVLEKGRSILVQVTKDAVGSKGAVLTTNISLAGRYLVLMPFDTTCGMSRKVEDEATRKTLRDKVKSLVANYGFIVRTNAVDQTKTALKHDLDGLVRLWEGVLAETEQGRAARLLHDDQDLVVQALRDHLDDSIEEVLIDDEKLLERAQQYVAAAMPRSKVQLTLYRERVPLFSRHGLEPKIAAIVKRVVSLPSGGSIVIDPVEALTAIDVNSGKATGASSQDETAYATNLEAADEVARQLRLRDIGGLVVVDFIDMRSAKHRREVEKALRDAMKPDKARSKVGHLSPNGLLEINRQRVGQALQLRTHALCAACQGAGRVPAPELVGLHLLRRIEAAAATGRLRGVRVALHPQLALEIQNRRRRQLAAIEAEHRIEIEIVADAGLAPSEERVRWLSVEGEAPPEVGSSGEGDERRPRDKAPRREERPTRDKDRRERRRGGPKEGEGEERGGRRKKRRGQAAPGDAEPARQVEEERGASPPSGVAAPAAQPAEPREPGQAAQVYEVSEVSEERSEERPAVEEPAAQGAPAAEGARRRRRRRRGRRPGALPEGGGSGSGEPAAPAHAPGERPAGEAEGAARAPADGSGAGGKRRRRRRRRRGRGGEGSGE